MVGLYPVFFKSFWSKEIRMTLSRAFREGFVTFEMLTAWKGGNASRAAEYREQCYRWLFWTLVFILLTVMLFNIHLHMRAMGYHGEWENILPVATGVAALGVVVCGFVSATYVPGDDDKRFLKASKKLRQIYNLPRGFTAINTLWEQAPAKILQASAKAFKTLSNVTHEIRLRAAKEVFQVSQQFGLIKNDWQYYERQGALQAHAEFESERAAA